MSIPSRTSWLLVLLALLTASCNDSIVCVFTTGCQEGSDAIASNPAVPPVDGEWVIDGPPNVLRVFPSGLRNAPSTPVVVLFDESMVPSTLDAAIEIIPIQDGIPLPAVSGVSQTLVGDGRVLVLLPQEDLDEGEYMVQLGAEAVPTDLTGQKLFDEQGSSLGTFTVVTTAPAEPQLLATYPQDGDTAQSETGAIVVVFDRAIDSTTIDGVSFDVKVDDVDPPQDPQPSALVPAGSTQPDTRAFVYRSVDARGVPVPLGTDAEVTLELSPGARPIRDDAEGEPLAPTTITFHTVELAAPLGASILSDPMDAIGLANLTDMNTEELVIEVELEGGRPDDFVDLFLFGEQRTDAPDKVVIAVQRFVRLVGTEPILTATFTREDIGIQLSNDPTDVRFEDGPLAFAFRMRRGSVVTPVKLLDLDPEPARLQDPILDTTAPVLRELLVPGNTTDQFRSDQRGISIAGHVRVAPNEPESVRSVEVVTTLGNNGTLRPVIGSDAAGLFLAAPIPAGILDPSSASYTSIIVYDSGLNATAPVSGTFTQLGAVQGSVLVPGGTVTVEVFDARTLAPVPGANVWVHSDQGNGVDFPQVQLGQTLADGTITLGTAGPPSVAAIVTVEATNYDLFTFHGVPTTRISVPLSRTVGGGRVNGDVVSSNPGAVALLPGLDRRYDDSRRSADQPRGFVGGGCTAASGELSCTYGPEGIEAGQLGARSFFAGDFSQTDTNFSAALLLQAFALEVPFDRVLSSQAQPGVLEVPFLLTDATVPPEEAAQGLPPIVFRVDAGSGVDGSNLLDDATTTGAPFVTLEVLIPGLPGSLAVSTGLAFDRDAESWIVRTVAPGAISAGGSLGSDGIVDDDPFVRMELRDFDGNAAGARPRLSTIVGAGPLPEFRALAVPAVTSPLPKGSFGGQALTVKVTQVIQDARSAGGLYRVRLRDDGGRGWTLWRVDPTGAGDTGDVFLRAPEVNGLSDGEVVIEASAFAWSGFSPLSFLWSDVTREMELFAFAEPFAVTKP